MSKKLLIIVLIILAIGAALAYTLMAADPKEETTRPTATQQADTAITPAPPAGAGEYRDYDEATVAATTGTKLLFFHAPWCPQCRQLDEDIKAKGAPAGVAIFKVDYDSNQELRKKYGVTLQTTIVRIDDKGELVKKYVSYDEPTLAAVVKNTL